MSARTVARALGAGRVAFGAAMLVAPRAVGRAWVGDDGERPGATALVRALGVRDLVLGLLALHTLDHPQVGPRCQRTLAACDAVDLLATLAVRDRLPASAVAGAALVAGGAAAGGLYAGAKL
jgi:hypothetical protein